MTCGGCRGNLTPHKVPVPAASCKTPQYQPLDGSITFPEGTEMFQVEGYQIDENDDRRLISNMPPCMYRITGVMLEKNGTFRPHHVCTGPCEHKSKPVNYDICLGCPLKNETTE